MYNNLMPDWNWSDQFYLKDSEGNVTENPDEEAITKYAKGLIEQADFVIKSGRAEEIDPDDMIDSYFLEDGQIVQSVYLGSLINPSGKYYTFWTSNQTEADVDADMIFWEVLEEEAGKADGWIEAGEGDPTDTFFMRIADKENKEDL